MVISSFRYKYFCRFNVEAATNISIKTIIVPCLYWLTWKLESNKFMPRVVSCWGFDTCVSSQTTLVNLNMQSTNGASYCALKEPFFNGVLKRLEKHDKIAPPQLVKLVVGFALQQRTNSTKSNTKRQKVGVNKD